MKKESRGTFFALFTAVISGFAIPINKVFVVGLDPTIFTAVRALFIGIAFFVIASFQSKFNYKKFKKVDWKYLLVIGFVGGGLAFLFYFTGLRLTTSGRGAFLHKTLPIYTTLLAVSFLKERVRRRQALALLVMFAGTVVLYSSKITPTAMWSNPSFGDVLIISATILWAVENAIAKKAMIRGESNFVVSFARMFFGSMLLFGIVALAGKMDLLMTLTAEQVRNLAISTGILFGYVFCWYKSLKLINVSKASTLLLLSPVISLLIGISFLGEPAPFGQLIGSALILMGAFFVTRVKSEFVGGI